MIHKRGKIIALKSEWMDGSLVRTVTRQLGLDNTKILVDVIEISTKTTSRERARKAAIAAARSAGCASVDYTRIGTSEITKNSFDIHSFTPIRTKVRSTTFAFSL